MKQKQRDRLNHNKFPKRIFVVINNRGTSDVCLSAGVSIEEADDLQGGSEYKDIPKMAEYRLVGEPFTVKHQYKVVRRRQK